MSFEKFYSVYPRRINKAQALKSYSKAIKLGVSDEQLINGAIEYQQWCDRNGTAHEYICHPATWLNQGRWDNDYRSDDRSKQTTRAGNNTRQSQTSLAMAVAVETAQKKAQVRQVERRSDEHGVDLPF